MDYFNGIATGYKNRSKDTFSKIPSREKIRLMVFSLRHFKPCVFSALMLFGLPLTSMGGVGATPALGRIDYQCKIGQPRRKERLEETLELRGYIAGHIGDGSEIQHDIYRLQEQITACGFTPEQVGATSDQIAIWIKSSREMGEQRIRQRIEDQSSWRQPSSGLLEQLQMKATSGDVVDPVKTAKFIDVQKSLGLASEKRVRASCSSVNLGPKFGPSRDLDSVGWCFGFAVADLLSYRLKKNISASDVSLSYFDSNESALARFLSGKKQGDYAGGTFVPAVNASLNRGLCLESKFSSRDNGRNNLQQQLNRIQDISAGTMKAWHGACANELARARETFPLLQIGQLNEALLTSTKSSFVSRLATEACEPRLHPKKIQPVGVGGDANTIFSAIDQQLSKQNPIAITLNAKALIYGMSDDTADTHGVVLIGRRFNEKSKSCEYLVRNNWGPSCASMSWTFDCDDSSKGHAWVPQEVIAKSLHYATYLE